MDLWSKGLGSRTLNLRLEKADTEILEDGSVKIKGAMGPPVHWRFSLRMKEEDLVDFFMLVNKTPDCAEFLANSEERWSVYSAMIKGSFRFVLATLKGLLFGFKPESETMQP